MAEYWYNTNFHSSINTTPYEVVYGQAPTLHMPYIGGTTAIETVDRSLKAREEAVQILKFHLTRAQDRMKNLAYAKRSDREFEVGVWVYLKLQPYRQVTVRKTLHDKLADKYYGPFQVSKKIGKMAYQLALPADAQIHPVFHVSQLKLCKGTPIATGTLPVGMVDGVLPVEPLAILER